jgi:hypothetical protein
MKLLSKAGIQRTQNRPSSQLIQGSSCVERLNAMKGAEELSIFLSIKC